MASSIPSQARAVDPFASYNSNTVNTLTRMLTYGENGIATPLSCDVSLDSTSNTQVVLGTGFVYQSDVWIHLSSNHVVDFTDPDHYYTFGTGFDEAGYYYIVLEYTYVKSRPAPQAKALIVKPSQIAAYTPGGSWLFLKAVKVEGSGPFHVVSVHNFDPGHTNNHREYIKSFAGGVAELPTHVASRDTARFVYGVEDDDFYFGHSDRWVSLSSVSGSTYQKDTSGFNGGELVYINTVGNIALAIATIGSSTADGVVTRVGTNGLIQTVGYVENVLLETGISISLGQLTYLSASEPGKVTTQKTSPFSQFTGRCVELVDSTTVNLLFHRGEPVTIGGAALGTYIPQTSLPAGASWISSGGGYYQDVDISSLDQKNIAVVVWDPLTNMEVQPANIEFTSISNMRVWMPFNTQAFNVFAVGPTVATIPASDIEVVTSTLSAGGSWTLSGSLYYQDVNVTSLTGQSCVVLVRDTSTKEKIMPAEIEFQTANNLRIWMPINTKELEVVAIGPSATPSLRVAYTTILASGASWVLSGSLYYQDLDSSIFNSDDVVLQFYDIDTDEVIWPAGVEFTSSNNIRIWMSDDTHQLNVTIIG